MDEFSDFQMAVAGPSHMNENSSSPAGNGRSGGGGGSGFSWGASQKQQQTGEKSRGILPASNQYFQRSPLASKVSHQSVAVGGGISPSSKVDKNVGSRLANYDLGIKSTNSQLQQTLQHNVPPAGSNNYSLIGEEDKYAALRALVSLEISDANESPEAATVFSSIPQPKSDQHEKTGMQRKIESSSLLGGKNAREDDFSDFGDFQSFSNISSITPTSAVSEVDHLWNTSLTIDSNGVSLPPTSEMPHYEFGEFVSVVPENATSGDLQAEVLNFNHSLLSHESEDIFMNENDEHSSRFDIDVLSLKHRHLQSSNNNVLPQKNLRNFVVEDLPAPVFCYAGDNFSNSNESASTTVISSDIPLDDLHVLPLGFIKTSLIGCDVGRISDNDNLESIRSASLMETSNEVLECIPSHERNKFDISPETRSIASLDLGSYCPTYDVGDGKNFCADNNWNGSGPINRNPKQSEVESGDSFNMDRGSNDDVSSDKYQCFRQDLATDTTAHVLTWSRCLESIKQIINAAVVNISGASDRNVIREVIFCTTGENYIYCLSKVYQVYSRVQFSYSRLNRTETLETLCSQIESLWNTLLPYFVGSDLMEKLTNIVTTEPTVCSNPRCGICLCPVENTSLIEYFGTFYHSGCANLWINNVEARLPSLSACGVQFDGPANCYVSKDMSLG